MGKEENKTYTKLEKVALWGLGLLMAGLLSYNTKMQMASRDNYTYIQPQIDKEQNKAIERCRKRQNESDSTNSNKNEATQNRINILNDGFKKTDLKTDILIKLNKEANQKWNEIEKYFKYQSGDNNH
jgi:hypothetical protein